MAHQDGPPGRRCGPSTTRRVSSRCCNRLAADRCSPTSVFDIWTWKPLSNLNESRGLGRHIARKLIIYKEKPMPDLSHIDPRSAPLLVMDYQVDTLTKFMTAAQSVDAIACVPGLIATALDVGMIVIHVVVAFRPRHP